jgi:hypothetical protein
MIQINRFIYTWWPWVTLWILVPLANLFLAIDLTTAKSWGDGDGRTGIAVILFLVALAILIGLIFSFIAAGEGSRKSDAFWNSKMRRHRANRVVHATRRGTNATVDGDYVILKGLSCESRGLWPLALPRGVEVKQLGRFHAEHDAQHAYEARANFLQGTPVQINEEAHALAKALRS